MYMYTYTHYACIHIPSGKRKEYIILFLVVPEAKEILLCVAVFTSVSNLTYSVHYFQDKRLYDLYLQIIHLRFNLKVKFSDAWIQRNLSSQQRKFGDVALTPFPSLIASHDLCNHII